MAATIEENRQSLTRLDSEIGDGDHGTNMRRGFQAAISLIMDMVTCVLSKVHLPCSTSLSFPMFEAQVTSVPDARAISLPR